MKIIQTLWTKPGLDAGWPNARNHFMSWALSCLQLKKYYQNVELFTDKLGKEILIDTLDLPYDAVHVTHQDLVFDKKLWALSKIHTYSLQKTPFFHIDSDIFIWDKFDKNITSPIVFQNVEMNAKFYKNTLKDIYEYFTYIPNFFCKEYETNIESCNMGVFGGKQIDTIQEYCQNAFSFVQSNSESLQYIRDIPTFNAVFEQYLLYTFLQKKGIACEGIHSPTNRLQYDNYVKLHLAPLNQTYVHIMGGYKKSEELCSILSKRLRKDYPTYHQKVTLAFQSKQFSNNNAFGNIKQPIYPRTIAFLSNIDNSIVIYKDATEIELRNIINKNSFSEDVIDKIEDLLSYESNIADYKKQLINTNNLIEILNNGYKFIDELTLNNKSIKIVTNHLGCILFSKWKWVNKDEILENMVAESGIHQTTLVPDGDTCEILEYTLDPLSNFLIDYFSSEKKLHTSVEEIHLKFFVNVDTLSSTQSYDRIMKAIIGLVYKNCLFITK